METMQGVFQSELGSNFAGFCCKTGLFLQDAFGRHEIQVEHHENTWCSLETSLEQSSRRSWIIQELNIHQDQILPLFGGKVKIMMEMKGDNCLLSHISSKSLGDFDIFDTFSHDGMVRKMIQRTSHLTQTQFWARDIQTNLWLKFTQGENVHDFFKGLSPSIDVRDRLRDTIVRFQVHQDSIEAHVKLPSDVATRTKFHLGKVASSDWMNCPNGMRNITMSKIGPHRYSKICQGSMGEHEEWTMAFTPTGLLLEGFDLRSGRQCSMKYSHVSSVFGPCQMIASSGFDEFGLALAISTEVIDRLKSDFQAIWSLEEMPNQIIHYQVESQVMPKDMTYKFDEEFEDDIPGSDEKFQVLETREGNTLTTSFRNPRMVLNIESVFMVNFVAITTKIADTSVETKTFLQRL